MKPWTLVEVVWDDIVIHSQWMSVRDAKDKKPERFRTVGWFLDQDDTALRIVGTRQNRKQKAVNDLSVIPVGCVVEVIPL